MQSLPWPSNLLAIRVIIIRLGLLGSLLLLALALLLARVAGQGLLKNFENLVIGDLLVRLHLADVQRTGATKLGEAVLGDGYTDVSVLHIRGNRMNTWR